MRGVILINKFNKKFICAVVFSSIVINQNIIAFAHSKTNVINNNQEYQKINNKENITLAASKWWQWAWRVAKFGTNYLNEHINVSPVYEVNSNYIKVGSGSIDFNKGNFGGIAEHDIRVSSTNSEIDAWAERSFVDWFSKINISFYSPYNSLISNKSVSHQQHFIINPSSTGTWKIRYTEPNKKRWSCWFFYDPVAPIYSMGYNQKTLINSYTGEKDLVKMYDINDKSYVIPSKSHKNLKNSMNNVKLNMKSLIEQTYDKTNKRFVNSFSNYKCGDNLIFKDTIQKISYDKNLNATKFTFNGINDEEITWIFKNNLTNNYKKGDVLQLKFKVVNEFKDENEEFETLNYFNECSNWSNTNNFADINRYLYK